MYYTLVMEKKYLLYWFVSLVEMANYFFKCIFERKIQLHSFYQTSRNSLMIDIAKIIMMIQQFIMISTYVFLLYIFTL